MARRGSLAYFQEQLAEASKNVYGLGDVINQLQQFIVQVADNMKRFEKEVEYGPSKEEIKLIITGLMGEAKAKMIAKFRTSAGHAKDINEFMLQHMIDMMEQHLVPDIEYDGFEFYANLEWSMEMALGRVDDWFDIVEAARQSYANGDAARQFGWMRIWDAAINGIYPTQKRKNYDKWSDGAWLAATYEEIMSARLALLNDKAPYWYFIEHGNREFKGGITFPYPSYNAKNILPGIKLEIEQKGKKIVDETSGTETRRTDGYYKRQALIDDANDLIDELTFRIEEEAARAARNLRIDELNQAASSIRQIITKRIKRKVQEYQGLETLEDLTLQDLQRIRDKVISRIVNHDEFSSERISDPALPSGLRTREIRFDIEDYLVSKGLGDVYLGDIF